MVLVTEFEMTAIREDLFIQFPPQNLATLLEPAIGFIACEKQPGKTQRLCVLEQVICQRVMLDLLAQCACLQVKTFERPLIEPLSRHVPLDPVHDSQ